MNTNYDLIKILIVDDQQDNLQVMLNSLFNGGYLNILCARNGMDALQIVHNELPGIIILDWDMPVMNGIEVLKKLQEDPGTKLIPVIVATGAMLEPRDLDEALASGATDYIRKPYDQVELLARVKSALDFSWMVQTIQAQKQVIEKQNASLLENEKRLTAILNASNIACIFIEKFIVIEASHVFCALTGFNSTEVIGQSFFYFFPNEFHKDLTEIERMDGKYMSVSLLNRHRERLPVKMMIRPLEYNNTSVFSVTFMQSIQFAQLNEQSNDYIKHETRLNDLSAEIETLQIENKALRNQIQFKTLQNAGCNEVIAEVSKRINTMLITIPSAKGGLCDELIDCTNRLNHYLNNKRWNEFRLRFAELHTDFYDKLILRYPTLTENDLRLCAFIKLKMSTKEIATVINQPVNSVKVARTRLRSKLQMEDASESLLDILAKY